MTNENGRPDSKPQAKPCARGHIEQPGEGRKTTQPGERDPQSEQPADLASTSREQVLER
ncbi:hypothetical protein [Cupriavidus sp. D39]|uniref:hypothetical protein n=1 Tax=Cupriavidus sp. D39 TaxID=2997877 RepID=UPI002271749D|nr:hypothetical protein [Cupriavidus sp. D39]MCY0854904.1 hypothetical protein [Cupriavidus sp. D39]